MSNEPVAWVEMDGELIWQDRNAAIGRNLYTHPVDDTALLRQALKALKQHIQLHDGDCICQDCAAITALRERLGEKT
jgi:hypothetical protein